MSDLRPDLNLLQEYRREYGTGFQPLRLWRDRRAILADPSIAALPYPPLANAPVRFALSFGLVPILAIGWCMSQVVEVLYPDRDRSGIVIQATEPVREELRNALAPRDEAAIAALSKSMRRTQMDSSAGPLWQQAYMATRPLSNSPDPHLHSRQAARDLIAAVRASSLPAAHQDVLLAKAHDVARRTGRLNRFVNAFTRSVSEGGPVMQALGILGMLLGAWLFGQTLRGDARFPRGEQGDRFYLYYGTSLVFWFLPATAISYGVGSFASAAGNAEMYRLVQWIMIAVASLSMIYLLAHSRRMALALGADSAQRGLGFAIGWRIVVSLLAAQLCLMGLGILVGIVGGMITALALG